MNAFTTRSALLTGLELIRRRPLLVLLWAAVLLARAIVLAVIYQGFMAWVSARGASGAPVMHLGLLAGAYELVKTGLSMVVSVVLMASAFRAILRPGAPTALRLGREELLMFAAQAIVQLVVSLPVLAALWGLAKAHSLGGLISVSRPIVSMFEIVGLFWGVVASVWAFDRLQIAPFRCWTIARGRFWLLAGLVVGVLVLRLVVNAGVDGVAGAMSYLLPAAGPPQDAFRASALFLDVMSAVLGALEIVFLAGIVSCAVRADGPEVQAASFSTVVSDPAS